MIKEDAGTHAAAAPSSGSGESREILRFVGAERLMHWALALPFILLYISAFLLLATGSEPRPRPFHQVFGWIHRTSGVCMIAFPPLAFLFGIRQWKSHLENMREGWGWRLDDIRWLLRTPKAVFRRNVELPEQGKFNAAEKLNFMMVTATYPLYIATGIWLWMPGIPIFAWMAHYVMAMVGLPLVLGHIFMATVNPSTRIGITGMINGWVDREWAKHHYRRWYRARFEQLAVASRAIRKASLGPAAAAPIAPVAAIPISDERFDLPATVSCASCATISEFGTWRELLERVARSDSLFCPKCHGEILGLSPDTRDLVADSIHHHIESGRAHLSLHVRTARSA
jgi:formate dehydrogenase subunit gamma